MKCMKEVIINGLEKVYSNFDEIKYFSFLKAYFYLETNY